MAFSPDGSLLASASVDRTVRVWSASTGQEVQKLEGVSYIDELSFTPDSSALNTNRGRFRISSLRASIVPSDLGMEASLAINNDWIEHNDKKLLWLPQEYRSHVSALHGNQLAIGLDNGTVSFLRIERP